MGGCVSSNGELTDRRQNLFHVWNVDELGNIFIPGQIEVTDTELVLYQKGKEPIRWPMRCLRRYGFDAELFSFESGRRCATGTGIYAFKCQRAEALFNLLQEQIQNSGQDQNQTTDAVGISSHSGVVNGMVAASSAAGNGSILRSSSLSVSDVGGPASGGNYLEPIVRHRARSIITNNNNNNNNSTGFRDGFSRMATQSLPSNLAFTDHQQQQQVIGSMDTTTTPHYVNEDLVTVKNNNGTCCTSGGDLIRSPLTPPAVVQLPALHEYANTTLMMTKTSISSALHCNGALERPKSLQDQCLHQHQHQVNNTSVTDNRTSEIETCTSGAASGLSAAPALTSIAHPKKVPYSSILDLPKNTWVGASSTIKPGSNGCRQVVLRGHSLDETTNYARLDDLLKQEHTSAQSKHLYMNVVPDNNQSKLSKDGSSVIMSSVQQSGNTGPSSNIHNGGSNSHHHHHHHHHHLAGGLLYGRQKSVESPSMSSSGVSSSVSTSKDSTTGNSHHNHYRHHSNSISCHLTTTTTAITSTSTTMMTMDSASSSSVSRQVNYAVLDLNHHRGSNSSGGSISMGGAGSGDVVIMPRNNNTAPTSPVSLATPPESLTLNPPSTTGSRMSPLEGYATIDFDRTVALSNVSAHPRLDDDESVRKTRHNSTISDLLLSKHSSTVSE